MTDQEKPKKRRLKNSKFPEPFEVELPPVDREATLARTKQRPVTAKSDAVVVEKDLSELPDVLEKRIVPLTGREVPLIPKGFRTKVGLTREEVEARFHLAFELIGGVERFALWADSCPGEFYRIYGKMLPSADAITQQPQQAIQINLAGGAAIPNSPLDSITLRNEGDINKKWDSDGS